MREKATKSHIGEGKAGDILRRRIQRLAAGKFEQEQPVLSLSEEKIEIEVLEGQDYTGEFVIEVSNHVPVKGLIYSSNPYMECLTPEFEGEEVRIGFQFHSEGFRVGDIQKGEFCIICNQLEYSLSFVVSIIPPVCFPGLSTCIKRRKRKRIIMVCRLWRTGSIDFRYGGVLGYDQCQATH